MNREPLSGYDEYNIVTRYAIRWTMGHYPGKDNDKIRVAVIEFAKEIDKLMDEGKKKL